MKYSQPNGRFSSKQNSYGNAQTEQTNVKAVANLCEVRIDRSSIYNQ
jgi:hypothetical protein